MSEQGLCIRCHKPLPSDGGLPIVERIRNKTAIKSLSVSVFKGPGIGEGYGRRVCGLACLIAEYNEAAGKFLGLMDTAHLGPGRKREDWPDDCDGLGGV